MYSNFLNIQKSKNFKQMKRIYLIGLLGLVVMSLSCNSNSKKKLWSQEQEKVWKEKCVETLMTLDVEKTVAEDHCDCMFTKTAKKYTPDEAEELTVEEERKIWENCDYRW